MKAGWWMLGVLVVIVSVTLGVTLSRSSAKDRVAHLEKNIPLPMYVATKPPVPTKIVVATPFPELRFQEVQTEQEGRQLLQENLATRATKYQKMTLDYLQRIQQDEEPKNPFDQFDAFLYINLDERVDRKDRLMEELRRMNVPEERVIRIPGVRHKNGALGCTTAHRNALRYARSQGYQRILVFEDDFVFKQTVEKTHETLSKVFDLHVIWDVLMLSAFVRDFQPTCVEFLVKAMEVQTASGYAVQEPFLSRLETCFEEAVVHLESGQAPDVFTCDQYWKSLQPHSNWFVLRPVLGYQGETFSDIEQKVTQYEDQHELDIDCRPLRFLVAAKTCQLNLDKAANQQKTFETLFRESDVRMLLLHFYGEPSLATPFQFDVMRKQIALRCKDDYFNLCHKFGLMMSVTDRLVETSTYFSSIHGVFTTDDDITFGSEFTYWLEQSKDALVKGKVVETETPYSTYFQDKSQLHEWMKNQCKQQFPSLLNHRIFTGLETYVAGGGIYMNRKLLPLFRVLPDEFMPFPETEQDLQKHIHADDDLIHNVCAFQDMNVGKFFYRMGIPLESTDLTGVVHWE